MKKWILAAGLVGVLVLSGCGKFKMSEEGWATNASLTSADEAEFSTAQTIVVDKKFNAFKDVYDIKVDDKTVATVTGKVFKDFGNEFILKTTDGKILATEYQLRRALHLSIDRAGEIRGADGETMSYVGEKVIDDLLNWGLKFHFFDLNDTEKGYSDQTTVLKIDRGVSYYDVDGNEEYQVKQNNKIILPSTYTLNVLEKDEDLSISRIEAVLLVCIEDAVLSARKDD